MQEIKNKTVFISALDWGMGHATRCVPVIASLVENNNTVIIGVTPLTEAIFSQEFPTLQKVQIPPYNIKYSSFLPVWMKLILDLKRIAKVIVNEKKVLQEIIIEYKINVVISDNRFGLYSRKSHCIFISHQLFLKAPFLNAIAQRINKKYILNFDEVWVPDYEDVSESLSSLLSHGKHFHKNVKYIGPQSRFKKNISSEIKYDYLFLISGPEPQNSIFQNLLLEKSKNYPQLKFALANNSEQKKREINVTYFISPDAKKLSEIICKSKNIICRSGFSTLMDLYVLKKFDLILVPTPGQTEQEYLAELWKEKFLCNAISQDQIRRLKFTM